MKPTDDEIDAKCREYSREYKKQIAFVDGCEWTREQTSEWISITERLPEVGGTVLVYRPLAELSGDTKFKITIYDGGENQISPQGVKHGFDCWCHPSHWIPIQPPKNK